MNKYIKLYEQFNIQDIEPYGEEDWEPYGEEDWGDQFRYYGKFNNLKV